MNLQDCQRYTYSGWIQTINIIYYCQLFMYLSILNLLLINIIMKSEGLSAYHHSKVLLCQSFNFHIISTFWYSQSLTSFDEDECNSEYLEKRQVDLKGVLSNGMWSFHFPYIQYMDSSLIDKFFYRSNFLLLSLLWSGRWSESLPIKVTALKPTEFIPDILYKVNTLMLTLLLGLYYVIQLYRLESSMQMNAYFEP